jgi:chorismate synthase
MMGFKTSRGDILIRELCSITEMEMAEQIQMKVWGADTLPCPKEILIPVQHEGGLLAGAFAGEVMVGLVFSFPTRDPAVQHSHLLATLDDWRGLGIGTSLKWFQRQWCLERGIRKVSWTVDPLRAANAEINVHLLGGICNTYLVDYYGKMQGIDAGAPTDRLLLEWYLDSPRVAARSENRPVEQLFPGAVYVNEFIDGVPTNIRKGLENSQVLIRLPLNFIELSHTRPDLALRWRLSTRELFLDYFKRGYAISEFTRVGGPAYLMEVKNS